MATIRSKIAGNGIKFIIIVFPIACIALIGSTWLMYQNYLTSVAGYQMLPSKKVEEYYTSMVAGALPQLIQVLFGYWFLTGFDIDKKSGKMGVPIYGLFSIIAFTVDTGLDTLYKVGDDYSVLNIIFCAIESIVMFTLGAELLFTLSATFCFDTVDDFLEQSGTILGRLMNGLSKLSNALTGDGDNNDDQQSKQFR